MRVQRSPYGNVNVFDFMRPEMPTFLYGRRFVVVVQGIVPLDMIILDVQFILLGEKLKPRKGTLNIVTAAVV